MKRKYFTFKLVHRQSWDIFRMATNWDIFRRANKLGHFQKGQQTGTFSEGPILTWVWVHTAENEPDS